MMATSRTGQMQKWALVAVGVALGWSVFAQTAGRGPTLSPDEQQVLARGQTIYTALCFSCHGADGRGAPKPGGASGETLAPSLVGSAHVQGHRDFVIKTVLYGLTGPSNGTSYPEVMIPMGSQKDDWVAAIGSFVRNSFGNSASFIAPADVARVRAMTTHKTSWTVSELEDSLPVPLQPQPTWRMSASEDSDDAANGLTPVGWRTDSPSKAGMWYQVELPRVTTIVEVQYSAPRPTRGDGPAATAPPPSASGSQRVAPQPELQLQVSTDGKTWSTPLAGAPGGMLTNFAFQPTRARFVRIVRKAPAPNETPWIIQNLQILRVPAPPGPTAR